MGSPDILLKSPEDIWQAGAGLLAQAGIWGTVLDRDRILLPHIRPVTTPNDLSEIDELPQEQGEQ